MFIQSVTILRQLALLASHSAAVVEKQVSVIHRRSDVKFW